MKRFTSALFAAVLCAIPAAAATPGAGNAALDKLAHSYFAADWKLDPAQATSTGVHDYDDQLGDFTAAGYAARAKNARDYLAQLDAIAPASLTPEAADDARILRARLQRAIEAIEIDGSWRHNPATYTQAASGAVFDIMARKFAPALRRLALVTARERQIPAVLAAGKANITTVDATTAVLARQSINGSIAFFSKVVPAAFSDVSDPAALAAFRSANDAAIAAIRDYLAFLNAGPLAAPSGTFAIGVERYARRLQLQELSTISLADYERVGVAALEATKAQFVATAKQIDPSKTPQQVADALGKDHPAAGALLQTAQDNLVALRKFVIDHHIITLPPDNDVKVVETPEFARQITFASMDSPGPLERVATEAYYNVTPVDPAWPAQRQEQHLSFFNNYALPIVSLHEVMPGHYVNFAINKHAKLSFIRELTFSPSFAEGWAHYDEQMMVDEGWGNGDPRVRLAQLSLALQREARYLVGLREHTQGMSVDEATRFFMDNAFMGEEPSRREALRGTQDPLYGYYTLGKLELLKLREDYKKKAGASYSLQRFHDELLAHGDPPMSIVRHEILGAADDGRLL